jgi:hypothetical protein
VLIKEVKKNIARQSQLQIQLFKILSRLRLNADEESLMFKTRDIYNTKAKIRREELDSLSSVQALMKQLNEEK